MTNRKNSSPNTPCSGGDDLHLRYDGIERIGEAQLEAIRRLETESRTATSGVVREGRVTAFQGRVPTGTTNPIDAARRFIEKYAPALGFDIQRNDDSFGPPRLVGCDEGTMRGVDTVVFPHRVKGVPAYRAGVAIGVDRGGSVRAVRAHLTASKHASKGRDAARARKAVTALLGKGELPEPTFELFDPGLVLGERGEPTGVWVFERPGDAPIQVLVEDGKDDVFRIVTSPGCAVGPLPVYHLNRVTGVPDMVLFPGPGLLLPESATRNPVAAARALFERFPKLFGTGAPASQLALGDVLRGNDPLDPTTTVVFHQRWGTLPVFGCQLRVHLSKALAVRSISGNFLRDPGVPTTPAVSVAAARTAASTTAAFDTIATRDRGHDTPSIPTRTYPDARRESATTGGHASIRNSVGQISNGGRNGGNGHVPFVGEREALASALKRATDFHHTFSIDPERAATIGTPDTEDRGLVVLPTSLLRSGQGRNHLAWWFRFRDADRFVSATTGTLVLTLSRLHAAQRVFDADDQMTPPVGANPQFLDGNPLVPAANLDPDAQGAAGAIAGVDAFWRIFRRDSWDGRGGDMDAYVDWRFALPSGMEGSNAGWDGMLTRTLYSPQLATPDVVGHEFTHGLIQATAGLEYVDESGAANEHYADLFGNLMFPDAVPGNWIVGEEIPGSGGLRDMRNPTVATYQNYLVAQPTKEDDFGGVHTNSGILNRAAVLMCDGGPPAGPAGIGRSRLARLGWDTLVFRLHPLASFSDVLHLTWAVSRELADAGSLGAPGIPGVAGVPPAFDSSVTDTVVWAFQQVGLVLDVQHGWYDVTVSTPFGTPPGPTGFETFETLYRGDTLTNGRTLTDMEVRFYRRGMLNGTTRVGAGGVFNAPDGSFSATIMSPTAGQLPTTSLETVVRITSPTALSVSLNGVPTIAEPAPQPPAQPPLTMLDTPRVAHWLDVVPFGRRYDDVVFEGVLLPPGAFVTDVELRVVDLANIIAPGGSGNFLIGSTNQVGVNVGEAHKGANIISRTLGGRSLEVRVHSWHDAYVAVRYILRFTIAGNVTALPPFTIRAL